jgi:hypothetical protein
LEILTNHINTVLVVTPEVSWGLFISLIGCWEGECSGLTLAAVMPQIPERKNRMIAMGNNPNRRSVVRPLPLLSVKYKVMSPQKKFSPPKVRANQME